MTLVSASHITLLLVVCICVWCAHMCVFVSVHLTIGSHDSSLALYFRKADKGPIPGLMLDYFFLFFKTVL